MRCTRARAAGALAAAALAITPALAAGQGDDGVAWRVSGTVSGSVALDTSYVVCNATGERAEFRQTVRVAATLRPSFVTVFRRATGMAPRFRVIPGGTWTRTGSSPVRVIVPRELDRCDTRVVVDCAGPVVVPDRGRRAKLEFFVQGRYAVGRMVEFPGLAESGVAAPGDPSRPYCSDSYYDETAVQQPFFILGGTDVESVAAMTSASPVAVRIPVARLLGRRAFRVVLPAARPSGCEERGEFLASCSESGSLRMSLTFRPAPG